MAAPSLQWIQYNTSGNNPSGNTNNRFGNNTASGFIKVLSTNIGTGVLDFGSANNTTSLVTSSTKVSYARLIAMNDATQRIFNMRVWVADSSDWGVGNFDFNHQITSIWTQNHTIDNSYPSISTTLPVSQNFFNSGSGTELKIPSNENSGVTSYLYLSNSVDTDVPVGNYYYTVRLTFEYA